MYEIAVVFMSLWAYVSTKREDAMYLLFTTLLLLAVLLAVRLYGYWRDVDVSFVQLAYALTACSILLAYPYREIGQVAKTVQYSVVGLVGMYLIGKLKIYRWKIVGLGCVLLVPVLLLVTRVKGEAINGCYVSIGSGQSVLTLGLLLMLVPIAIAYLIRNEVDNPRRMVVNALPVNQIVLLAWTVAVAFLAGVVNNEYATVLIVCGTSGLMFLFYGRNVLTKAGFAAACLLAMAGVMAISTKVRTRWCIFTNIEKAYATSGMEQEAAPVKYILDTATTYGLFGIGNGELSKKVYANLTSDYAISGYLYNCGLLFTLLLIVITVLLIVKLLRMNTDTVYDRIVVEVTAIMLILMTVLSVAGPISACLMAGIGTPFSSVVKSLNVALFANLGLVLSIREEGGEKCWEELEQEIDY